jgi:hypothetical protein
VKVIGTLFCVLVLSAISLDQNTSPEQIIRRSIDTGITEGHDQKVIGILGDAAAVSLTKVLGERKLTATETDSILGIVVGAFADPSMVADISDREPKTSLFVLQYLNSISSDPRQKVRIAEARSYILGRYEEYVQKTGARKN